MFIKNIKEDFFFLKFEIIKLNLNYIISDISHSSSPSNSSWAFSSQDQVIPDW